MRQMKVTVPDRLVEASQRYRIDVDAVCSEALYQALARQLPLLKLTARSRELLLKAEQEAVQLGHGFIGTEHILLAILSESHGVADAALRELGLIETVRAKLHEIMASPGYNSSSNRMGEDGTPRELDQDGRLRPKTG